MSEHGPWCGGIATSMRNHDDRQPCDRPAGHGGPHMHHDGAQLVHQWSGPCIPGTVCAPDPQLFEGA